MFKAFWFVCCLWKYFKQSLKFLKSGFSFADLGWWKANFHVIICYLKEILYIRLAYFQLCFWKYRVYLLSLTYREWNCSLDEMKLDVLRFKTIKYFKGCVLVNCNCHLGWILNKFTNKLLAIPKRDFLDEVVWSVKIPTECEWYISVSARIKESLGTWGRTHFMLACFSLSMLSLSACCCCSCYCN